MSNIGKILSFVIFICFFQSAVFAEEKQSDYGFSITPSFGMVYGQAKEIVYKDSKTSNFLSELQWDIMPLLFAGLAVDFGPVDNFAKHGLIISLSFKMGIPRQTGIMIDRDWQYINSNALTDYSRHDNFSERAILADLSFGYSFPLHNFIALGMNLDFSFMHYYWNAKDGYGQYLDRDGLGNILPGQIWTDEIPKVIFNGTVIKYTQNWFILSPGVFIKFRLGRFFSLNGNFNYSPLIYCVDRDEHPRTMFLDYIYFGHYLKGSGSLTFSPMDKLDLTLFLSYSSITDSRGDAYVNSAPNKDIAGGGYTAIEFGLLARLRFSGLR
jgi:outer membrane protease